MASSNSYTFGVLTAGDGTTLFDEQLGMLENLSTLWTFLCRFLHKNYFSVGVSAGTHSVFLEKLRLQVFQIGRGALLPIVIGRLSSWALDWPQLGQDFVICFQKHFKSPLHLDAAFDNDLESAELVQAIFPDMVAEEVMDVVAVLMIWKESNVRSFKRARLHVVEQAMVVPLQLHGSSVQDVYKRLVQTNVVSLIEAHTKRRQKILKLDAETRSKRSDVERKKYTLLLSQVIMDAGLPVVSLIQTLGGFTCLGRGGATL